MSNQNVIRNLKDFHAVASKFFKCGVRRISDETNAKGYMGVKLIVGQKLNPVYDAAANPNRPELSTEERVVERAKLVKQVPDIRIVWVKPGMTADELTKEFLLGIKKSLEIKTPIVDTSITGISTMGPKQKSDAEIAAEIAAGKDGNAELDEFDDETDEIGFDDEDVDDNEVEVKENKEFEKEEDLGVRVSTSDNREILDAIKTLNGNINTLASDLSEMNDRIAKVEKKKGEK
jgi:hypothetical protein